MSRVKVAPSLLCMDMLRVGEQVRVMNRRADYLHADLMDLRFVKNIGLGVAFVRAVCQAAEKPVDCHIMAKDLDWWLPALAGAGASMLTPHIEVTGEDTPRILASIRAMGCRAGLAISPGTPAQALAPYLPLVDKVTVMTIEPGFPGAPFLWDMLDKIRQLAQMRSELGLGFEIEMDGSCCDENFAPLREAGVDVFVLGAAALFGRSQNLETAFDRMEESFGRKDS
ncbi:MAG: allulose-6-phosphate 3-epimerase [Candidatus Ventricola sp.]